MIRGTVVTAAGEFPPDFATWRGSLWARAQEIFTESPVGGHGPGYWVQQPQESGFIANYSPHNLWLEIAVSGGAIALLGAVIAGVTLLRGSPSRSVTPSCYPLLRCWRSAYWKRRCRPGGSGLPHSHTCCR